MSIQTRAEPSAATIEAEGWTRRFTAIGPRLHEAIALYRELGYELRLEPTDARDVSETGPHDETCAQCLVMTLARTIYTRRPGAASGARDEGRGMTERVTA